MAVSLSLDFLGCDFFINNSFLESKKKPTNKKHKGIIITVIINDAPVDAAGITKINIAIGLTALTAILFINLHPIVVIILAGIAGMFIFKGKE